QRRARSRLHDAGKLPTAEGAVEHAVSTPHARELINERAVEPVTHVVAGRSAIEFRIPEVLIVLEAGDVVRGEIASLRRNAPAQRVVDFPRIAVREALPQRGLQSVVDHRLAAPRETCRRARRCNTAPVPMSTKRTR